MFFETQCRSVYRVHTAYLVSARGSLQRIFGCQDGAADDDTEQDEVSPVVVRARSPAEHAESARNQRTFSGVSIKRNARKVCNATNVTDVKG